MRANLKSLPFTVLAEFFGQTDLHKHFLFYIIDLLIINID